MIVRGRMGDRLTTDRHGEGVQNWLEIFEVACRAKTPGFCKTGFLETGRMRGIASAAISKLGHKGSRTACLVFVRRTEQSCEAAALFSRKNFHIDDKIGARRRGDCGSMVGRSSTAACFLIGSRGE